MDQIIPTCNLLSDIRNVMETWWHNTVAVIIHYVTTRYAILQQNLLHSSLSTNVFCLCLTAFSTYKLPIKGLRTREGYSCTLKVDSHIACHAHAVPLPYLLTPWSRVLLEKLTGSAASQEIPRIFGTRRFNTIFTSAHHLSLSWANSIQSPQPRPTSWRSILILSSHLRLGLPCNLLIHTCHAVLLACSNSAVSFVKVGVVAGNIWTASPTV